MKQHSSSPIGEEVSSHRNKKASNPTFRATAEKYRFSNEIANRLIAYRIAHSLTQHDLADRLKTAHSKISLLERGDQPLSLDMAIRIGQEVGFAVEIVDRGYAQAS